MSDNLKKIVLSVVVPAYNRQATIVRTLDSILRTPRNDIEVIVVDDGSTDKTADIVHDIADERITLIRNRIRQNANVARNKGIQSSQSDLIVFLDSDDEFLAGRVDRIIDFFQSHAQCDILFDSFLVEKKGKIKKFSFREGKIADVDLEKLLVSHAIPITFSSISVRKSRFNAPNLLDRVMKQHDDRDFLLTQIANHANIYLGNGQDVIKHQGSDSISRSHIGHISGLDAIVKRHPCFGKKRVWRPIVISNRTTIHKIHQRSECEVSFV